MEQQTQEQLIKQLQNKIKQYQTDRFCQGGCAVYQYDKLQKYQEYFETIRENTIQVKAFLYSLDEESTTIKLLQTIQDICDCALDGSLW